MYNTAFRLIENQFSVNPKVRRRRVSIFPMNTLSRTVVYRLLNPGFWSAGLIHDDGITVFFGNLEDLGAEIDANAAGDALRGDYIRNPPQFCSRFPHLADSHSWLLTS